MNSMTEKSGRELGREPKKEFKKFISSLMSQYEELFSEHLSVATLSKVLVDEIHRRRAEFIRLKILAEGFSFGDLIGLLAHTKNQTMEAHPPLFPQESLEAVDEVFAVEIPVKQKSRKGRKPSFTADQNLAKRRAYARAYYNKNKNKKSLEVDDLPASETKQKSGTRKSFKTSDDQRAYQKSYYLKRKAERLSKNSSEDSSKNESELPVKLFRTKLRKNPNAAAKQNVSESTN